MMRQQSAVHKPFDPYVVTRFLERTMRLFGIQACEVQKTKKVEAEKGKMIVIVAKVALE